MNSKARNFFVSSALALLGIALFFGLWLALNQIAKDLPTPAATWAGASMYIVEPFAYRGEQDQGLLRLTGHSLSLVARGYFIALIIGAPIGFCLGLSKNFTRIFDPLVQVLRPVSPLAWFPLGMVLFLGAGGRALEYGALFTIAVCAMWPTVLTPPSACAPSRSIIFTSAAF